MSHFQSGSHTIAASLLADPFRCPLGPGEFWAVGRTLPLIPDKTKKKPVQAVGRHKFPSAFCFACFSMNNHLLVPVF